LALKPQTRDSAVSVARNRLVSPKMPPRSLASANVDLLRATAPTDPAGARFREGCMNFGVRLDSTDAELDAITPFEGERN